MQGTGGEVVPFDRGGAGREDYDQAIQLWFQTRDVAETLSREEIGAMQGFARVDAQRKAIIIHLANYYREHDRADVAPGVLVIQTLLSDNEKGGSTISQPTLAKLFGRSISSIGEAQKRLRDGGAIVTGRGRYAITHPVIPRAVTKSYNHLTWLVSAVCDQDETLNLPAPRSDCQSTGQTGGLKLDENQSLGRTLGLKTVNQPVEGISINRPDPMLLHYRNSKEERAPREGAFGKVAAAVGLTMASAVMPLAAAPHPVEQVMQGVAECWQTPKAQMAAASSSSVAKLQRQIWVTPTGRVEVAGDFKAELEREYPLVDLKCGLGVACPHVKPDSGVLNCIQAVHRQFAYMQNDNSGKEKRAAAYAKPAEKKSSPFRTDDIPLTRPMPREDQP